MLKRLQPYAKLPAVLLLGIAEQLFVLVSDLVMTFVGAFSWPLYRRWKAWLYRRHAANTADAIEAVEAHPLLYGPLAGLEHPGDVDQTVEGLRAEMEYYERRAEILEEECD